MKLIIKIVALLIVFRFVQPTFCSAYCSLGDCNGITSSDCLGCDFPLTLNSATNQCQITNPQIILVGDQSNIVISANVSLNTMLCSVYSFQGLFDKYSRATLTYSQSITQHFRVVLYFWVILFDGWSSNDNFTITLRSTGNTRVIYVADASVHQTLCSKIQDQNYMKARLYFPHSSTTGNIIFDIDPYHSGNREWGIKEPILFAQICNSSCDGCTGSSNSECIACATGFYQSGNTCSSSCILGYVPPLVGSVCLKCDASCNTCQNTTSLCLTCSTSYLMIRNQNSCVQNCPSGYFEFNTECLDCLVYCVNATTIGPAFVSTDNKTLRIDVSFSTTMDFISFPIQDFLTFSSINDSTVNLSNQAIFKIQISEKNSTSYRVQIEYLGNSGLDFQLAFEVALKYQASKNLENGYGYRLHDSVYLINGSIDWYIGQIVQPNPQSHSQPQPKNYSQLSTVSQAIKTANNRISETLSYQYVQQIKKTGIFAFFFPGIQLTSLSLLSNKTKGVNNYQAARFWGLFVFYDVPQWQKQSNTTNFIITEPSFEVVKNSRLLFETSSVWFRFRRTGFTSFFIFDAYMPLMMIFLVWLILVVSFILAQKCRIDFFRRNLHKVYILFHKTHQITMFYILLAVVVEWNYFSGSSLQRWLSLGLQIIALVYFLVYHLYVYSELVQVPIAFIQTKAYEKMLEKYSIFVRNVKYLEYETREKWKFTHIFRPYNFQLFSNYKWCLMVISVPLFYQNPYGQFGTLIAIQIAEIIRVIIVRPYYQQIRNLFRIFLQFIVLLFFLFSLLNQFEGQRLSNGSTISKQFYEISDWVVFSLIFTINVGLIVFFIADAIYSCFRSSRFRIQQSRRRFYLQKLEQVDSYESKKDDLFAEQEFEGFQWQRTRTLTPKNITSMSSPKNVVRSQTPLSIDTFLSNASYCLSIKGQEMREYSRAEQNNIKRWIKLGNLNYFDYEEYQEIPIKIQEYRIYKSRVKQGFQIKTYKAIQIYMDLAATYRKKNNILITKSINKVLNLGYNVKDQVLFIINGNNKSIQTNTILSSLVYKIYDTYAKSDTKYVYFQLFMKVNQKAYQPGEQIKVKYNKLFQIIKEEAWNGKHIKERSEWIFQPFPIAPEILNSL